MEPPMDGAVGRRLRRCSFELRWWSLSAGSLAPRAALAETPPVTVGMTHQQPSLLGRRSRRRHPIRL
jgi:hypothetical protein